MDEGALRQPSAGSSREWVSLWDSGPNPNFNSCVCIMAFICLTLGVRKSVSRNIWNSVVQNRLILVWIIYLFIKIFMVTFLFQAPGTVWNTSNWKHLALKTRKQGQQGRKFWEGWDKKGEQKRGVGAGSSGLRTWAKGVGSRDQGSVGRKPALPVNVIVLLKGSYYCTPAPPKMRVTWLTSLSLSDVLSEAEKLTFFGVQA